MKNRTIYSGFDALIFILLSDILYSFSPFFDSASLPFCVAVCFLLCVLIARLSQVAAKKCEGPAMGIVMPCFAFLAAVMTVVAIVHFLNTCGQWGKLYSENYFAFFLPVTVVLCALWCVFSGQTTVYRCALLLLPFPIVLSALVVAAPFANGMTLAVTYFRSQSYLPEIFLAIKAALLMGFDIFAAYVAAPSQTLKSANKATFKIKGIFAAFITALAVTACTKRFFYGSEISHSDPCIKLLDTAFHTQFGTILLSFKTIALILRAGLCFLVVHKAAASLKTRAALRKSTNFSSNGC